MITGVGVYPGETTSWHLPRNLERGAPFEVGVVSSVPNVLAFYAGSSTDPVSTSTEFNFYVQGDFDARRYHRLDGNMIVFNATPSRWCSSYRVDCGSSLWFQQGMQGDYGWGNEYFKHVGHTYYFGTDGAGFSYSSRYTNGCANSCVPSSGYAVVSDAKPGIRFPTNRYCKGQEEVTFLFGIQDQNGVDDIGDFWAKFYYPGETSSYTSQVWVQNTTAQRYNDWWFNRNTRFGNPVGIFSLFNNYLNVSLVNDPRTTDTSAVLRLRLSVKPGRSFDFEDIYAIEGVVNDAQFSGILDPYKIEGKRYTELEWIDPPTVDLWWDPEVVNIDPDVDPQLTPVKWAVSDGDRCRLRVAGPGCVNRNYGWGSCDGEQNVRIRKDFSGDTATCTATLDYEHTCGDDTLTATLTVLKAQPWAMTAFGDTYSYLGYGEDASMQLWEVSSPAIPGWAKSGSGEAYFSTYLVSKYDGEWPSSDSLRDYLLNNYSDANRTQIGGSGIQASIYDYIKSLVDVNSDACSADGITIVEDTAFTASTDTCGPNDKKVFLIDGNANFNRDWGASDPDAGCIVVASGNVRIRPQAENINGFILHDGIFTTDDTDTQLLVKGGVVTTGVNLSRSSGGNADDPGELLVYDPKYLTLFRDCLGENYPFQVREYGYSAPE